jgi:UDP-glucuronate decarboxylase
MAKNDGRVVTNFLHQALNNEAITVYGKGEQTRSFCYVDDLIDGLYKLFSIEGVTTPINLGNPTPVTMLDLAQEIIDITGSQSEITYKELPQDDPKERRPDISKARSILGWSPSISRDVGLKRTLEFIESH